MPYRSRRLTFARLTLALTLSMVSLPGLCSATAPQALPKAAQLDAVLAEAIRTAPDAAAWPNNDYARILDLADLAVKSDGTVVADYRETYKLFNERGRKLAEVSLPYNSSYQTLTVIKAQTVRPDGTVVAVKPDDMRATSTYSDFPLYDDSRSIGFSMPAVEDGCVIDYRFRVVSRPTLFPGQFWQYWAFSGPEPVGVSRLVLHVPADKAFEWKGYQAPSLKPAIVLSADGKTKTYTWEMSAIRPAETEPVMPDASEVTSWMEMSSLGSWQDIARWYWGLARPQARATDGIRQAVAKLTEGKQTDADKARAIYDWVANRVRYVGLEFGLSAFKPHAAGEVYDKLYGDCKDKATLLITMLDLAGIKAYPVLLHADDRRETDKQLPSLNGFNHCIALATVGGREVWLDATAETCEYGDIPAADRGVRAFVVRDGIGAFETIPPYAPDETGFQTTVHVSLRADGSADMRADTQMRGADAQQWRAYVRSMTPDQRKQMVQTWAQAFSTATALKDFTLPDGTDKAGPYAVRLQLAAPTLAKCTKHFMVLPASIGGHDSDDRNPFTKETRVWPISIDSPTTERSVAIVDLPEGYRVEETPADVDREGPLFRYQRTITVAPDGRSLTIALVSSTRAGAIPAADYQKVRGYYDAILKAADDIIVLRKTD